MAVAALRVKPERLLDDFEFLGLLFESMVIRGLRIYAQAADARVFHYFEKDGLEVDAIVEARAEPGRVKTRIPAQPVPLLCSHGSLRI